MSRHAKPITAWVITLILIMGAGVALLPGTASAAGDSITQMSVDFDIQPDGSVDVRYELDWHFGSDDRHGIDFGIATRERWDADPTQDVVYDVSDVSVSSPSGAPDSFSQSLTEQESVGSLDLRIGDPVETVDGRDATYVISYRLGGALRTFDGRPEFFWDVTAMTIPTSKRSPCRSQRLGACRKPVAWWGSWSASPRWKMVGES